VSSPGAREGQEVDYTLITDCIPAKMGGVSRAVQIHVQGWEGNYMSFNGLDGAFELSVTHKLGVLSDYDLPGSG